MWHDRARLLSRQHCQLCQHDNSLRSGVEQDQPADAMK
nr:hypothetical protein [Kibdelosporangium sp. MJ126-NF4]CTQ92456.1 hypothetical protein [Kibdelosporangium sp. MJ126-NF4]